MTCRDSYSPGLSPQAATRRERLLKHARRLADADGGGDRESLTPDNQPSYLAVADTNAYDQKREKIERGMAPDPRER